MELFGIDAGFMLEKNFSAVILYLSDLIVSAKHPCLELRVGTADGLAIYVAVTLVVLPSIVAVEPVNVVRGIQAPVGDIDDPAAVIFPFYSVDDGTHVYFLGFVSGEEIICDRDTVPVHEQPHPDNGVRAMVFLRTTFAVLRRDGISFFINGAAFFIQVIHVRVSDVKIEVGAVKIGNRNITLADLF